LIDVGGVALVRAAAKNYARVTVVVDPSDYQALIEVIQKGQKPSIEWRKQLAVKAFGLTAAYDATIADHLSRKEGDGGEVLFPSQLILRLEQWTALRYGENPHQRAALYTYPHAKECFAKAAQVGAGGKELSYNNLLDGDAGWALVSEFELPAAAIIKHATPCGVATASVVSEAYQRARDADPVSAFGGVVALNRVVDGLTAKLILETFIECVVAPGYEAEAIDLLRRRKNLRLLEVGARGVSGGVVLQLRSIDGGVLVQEVDRNAEGEVRKGRVVTKRFPTEEEWVGLEFAWKVAKHVKSNAIVVAQARGPYAETVGIGGGQTSRIGSVEIAVKGREDKVRGSVLASDGFFPFPDGVEAAAAMGIAAIVQPGGSVRDEEVVARADEFGIAMVLTGRRHFRH
ncbi:MAG: bifunctional phosphoribosylaminoimidazolecarboxamide formyltransferase/IMP cyclohydrolase, partial [Sandaracinaceae bacterium]|nr:bifunctional phosphoribosylaminoimidazolecarboxamide formyltransferase/IMP cyclohydrolase [Sandaracinaceae bacterium]